MALGSESRNEEPSISQKAPTIIPPELLRPVPRPLKGAGSLLEKNRFQVRGLTVGMLLAIPTCILIFFFKDGSNGFVPGAITGIVLEIVLFGYWMGIQFNGRLAKNLFCYGTVVIGEVLRIQINGDGSSTEAITYVHARYQTIDGKTFEGQSVTVSKEWETETKQGSPIVVLYDPEHPDHYAVYSPAMGVATSRAKPVRAQSGKTE